jgi:hypothetical protein
LGEAKLDRALSDIPRKDRASVYAALSFVYITSLVCFWPFQILISLSFKPPSVRDTKSIAKLPGKMTRANELHAIAIVG